MEWAFQGKIVGVCQNEKGQDEVKQHGENPFSNTPSVDAVMKAVDLSTRDRSYKRIRIVMYSPETGEAWLVRRERGKIILLRDAGFHPLGILGWYDKGSHVHTVARIFPWFEENPVAGDAFGQICDAETAKLRKLFEHRDLN